MRFLKAAALRLMSVTAILCSLASTSSATLAMQFDIGQDGTDFLLWSDGRLEVLDTNAAARSAYFAPFSAHSVVQTGQITWEIAYDDLMTSPAAGFADPTLGAARRAAFEDAVRIVGETLASSRTVTVQIRVTPSRSVNSPTLASAGTGYPSSGPAFLDGHLATHIQSGFDPDPAGPDMVVEFNFYHRYHLGQENPPSNATDLRSVAVHEIGHALGITSLLNAAGRSRRSGGNPGVFTRYDGLLALSVVRSFGAVWVLD